MNLTSVMFLGGKALDTIMGIGDGSLLVPAILGLAFVAQPIHYMEDFLLLLGQMLFKWYFSWLVA